MLRALGVRSGSAGLPSVLLAILLLLTGLAAWLGVDGAPAGPSGRLAQLLSATEDTGTARFVETASQVSVGLGRASGTRRSPLYRVLGTGSVDFSTDEVALGTRVVQQGQPPTRYETYVARGTLYERTSLSASGPFDRWTEQPIAYDPVLSIPAFAEVQSLPASVSLRRLGPGAVNGTPTTRFEIGPDKAVCTIPGGLVERLETTVTVSIDAGGLLRRISLDETVWISSRPRAPLHPTFTPSHFQTVTEITLSDFGTAMVFQRPTDARKLLEQPGGRPVVPAPRPSCGPLEGL